MLGLTTYVSMHGNAVTLISNRRGGSRVNNSSRFRGNRSFWWKKDYNSEISFSKALGEPRNCPTAPEQMLLAHCSMPNPGLIERYKERWEVFYCKMVGSKGFTGSQNKEK